MKSRFINGPAAPLLLCAALSVPLHANDWINSGSTISNSGNVGIGVVGPTSRFQVETDGTPGAPGSYPSTSSVHFLSWAGDGPSTETGISLFRFSAGRVNTTDPNASRALILEVTTDDKHVFGIRGNGYLGVGTNTPLLPLDVRGRASIAGATAGQEALVVDQTVSSGAILNLRQGGISKVIVDNAGNLGIGITSPASRLHVESDGTSGNPGNYPSTPLAQFTSWASDGPSTETGIPLFRFNAARVATTDPNSSRAVVLEVATDDKRVFGIRGNGNVGIGTANPQKTLDVVGDAKISGTLEVVATIKTKVWSIAPDYVFEKDYKLASLEHVEKYVDKHKHLPEVPSAREIKEKGIDLAEMNMKLLRKVEELTLYSIQQQKDIQSLNNRLKRFEENAMQIRQAKAVKE